MTISIIDFRSFLSRKWFYSNAIYFLYIQQLQLDGLDLYTNGALVATQAYPDHDLLSW